MSVRKMKNVCLLGLVALLDVREPAFAQAAAGTYSIGSVPVEVMLRSPSVPTAGSTSLSPDGKRFAYTRCDSAKNAAAHPQDAFLHSPRTAMRFGSISKVVPTRRSCSRASSNGFSRR